MQTLRGSREPVQAKEPRGVSKPLAISIAVHVVLALVVAPLLIAPATVSRLFGSRDSREVIPERIGFLRLPQPGGPPVAGRSGGDNRPLSESPPVRLVAPTDIPTSIPAIPTTPSASASEGGSGPLVGSGGPTRGIRPSYTGPRVWAPPGEIVAAPKSAKEKLDSAIVSIIAPFNDSVAIASGQRKPGDWTVDRGGRKYGIDPQFIRLGKVSIPTPLLALLPMNQQANPTADDRNKLQNQLHADIFWQAQRGMNEADFKKAVKSIRERKERERAVSADGRARDDESPAPSGSQR